MVSGNGCPRLLRPPGRVSFSLAKCLRDDIEALGFDDGE